MSDRDNVRNAVRVIKLLRTSDEELERIIDELQYNTVITYLSLTHRNLIKYFDGLLANIDHITTLQSLCLRRCQLNDGELYKLCDYLQNHENVTKLSINNNHFTHDGIKVLAKHMENSTIKNLSLYIDSNESLNHLIESLPCAIILVSLSIHCTNIDVNTLNRLLRMIRFHPSLKELKLSAPKIILENDALLSNIINYNEILTQLSISFEVIDAETFTNIANVLKNNTNLRKLKFIRCAIDDTTCIKIAEALRENTYLEQLIFMTGDITDIGAKSLGEMLTVNSSLIRLNVLFNRKIGMSGANHIMEGLKHNFTLQQFYLCRCGCEDMKQTLSDMVSRRARGERLREYKRAQVGKQTKSAQKRK